MWCIVTTNPPPEAHPGLRHSGPRSFGIGAYSFPSAFRSEGTMRQRQERVVRATRIDSHNRKPKTYAPDRACEACGAALSKYNPTHRCWCHGNRKPPRLRGVA